MLVDPGVIQWLTSFGLVKDKNLSQGADGRVSLPPQLAIGFQSGEKFVDLLNAIFSKHSLPALKVPPNANKSQVWERVGKGLQRLAVDLDKEVLDNLASGEASLVEELLGEVHEVYTHWAATKAKAKAKAKGGPRGQSPRPGQPAQGKPGYGAPRTRGPKAASTEPEESAADDDSEAKVAPASSPSRADGKSYRGANVKPAPAPAWESPPPAKRQAPAEVQSQATPAPAKRQAPAEVQSQASPLKQSPRGLDPQSQVQQPPNYSPVPAGQVLGQQPLYVASSPVAVPTPPPLPPPEPVALGPTISIAKIGSNRQLESAADPAEFLAMSIVKFLRVNPSEALALLGGGAGQLSKIFVTGLDGDMQVVATWLDQFFYFCGSIVELIIAHPEHLGFVFNALGHSLRSPSFQVAEMGCKILATLSDALCHAQYDEQVFEWFVNSAVLRDVVDLLNLHPHSHRTAAALVFNSCRNQLHLLFAQYLKQNCSGEKEYIVSAHTLITSLLERQDASDALLTQGVFDHFMMRSLQRLEDEQITVATRQACMLLMSDLWLAHEAQRQVELSSGLLTCLKKASQCTQSSTLRLVAFSCLFRLLECLCQQCNVQLTPAVYRTLVYSLMDTEDRTIKEFALRNLCRVLEKNGGVPVGVLVEPMVKKIEMAPEISLSAADIELFIVIVRHRRCTLIHADLLFKVLAHTVVQSQEHGRSASLPLLIILDRFQDAPEILDDLESLVQISLSCLLKRPPAWQRSLIMEFLAKIVCMEKGALSDIVKGLLQQISKAYLTSFEDLHPDLKTLLSMWPKEVDSLLSWATKEFRPETPDYRSLASPVEKATNDKVEAELERVRNGQAWSATPLVAPHSMVAEVAEKLPLTAGLPPPLPPPPPPLSDATQPRASPKDDMQKVRGPSASAASERPSPSRSELDSAKGGFSPKAQVISELTEETQSLRQELEEAHKMQQQVAEEATQLREELDSAKQMHSEVVGEIGKLQALRDELIGAKGSGKGGGSKRRTSKEAGRSSILAQMGLNPSKAGRKVSKGAISPVPTVTPPQGTTSEATSHEQNDVPDEDAAAKAIAFLKEFSAPLHSILLSYRSQGSSGMKASEAVQLFTDFEIVPAKVSKKSVADLSRNIAGRADSMQMESFLVLLMDVATAAFKAEDASPIEEFGVVVPLDESKAVLQAQALVQHMRRVVPRAPRQDSRGAVSGFVQAFRQYVIKYISKTLSNLNLKKKDGQPITDADIPLGFELRKSNNPLVYAVPAFLPVPMSDRHCAEILDSICADALGFHFLEPLNNSEGSDLVVVKAREDWSTDSLPGAGKEPRKPPPAPSAPSAPSPAPELASAQAVPSKARGAPKVPALPIEALPETKAPQKEQKVRPRDAQAPPKRQNKTFAEHQAEQEREAREKQEEQERKRKQRQEFLDRKSKESATNIEKKEPAQAKAPAQPTGKKREASSNRRQAQARKAELKDRQDSIATSFVSQPVQSVFEKFKPGLHRVYDFFAKWTKTVDDRMQVASWCKMGSCFGILDAGSLKIIFNRHAGGGSLSFDEFKDGLYECLVRLIDPNGQEVAFEHAAWSRHLERLCRHMSLDNGKELRKKLDAFKTSGEQGAAFKPGTVPDEDADDLDTTAPVALEQGPAFAALQRKVADDHGKVQTKGPTPAEKKTTEEVAEPASPRLDSKQKKKREVVQKSHKSKSEFDKQRQEQIKATFKSREVQAILELCKRGLSKVYDFFVKWSGVPKNGEMQLLGWVKMGECFGLLDPKTLQVFFRKFGQSMSLEAFTEALFLCILHVVDPDGQMSPFDSQQCSQHMQALCTHMLARDADKLDLRRRLDTFKTSGAATAAFSLDVTGGAASLVPTAGDAIPPAKSEVSPKNSPREGAPGDVTARKSEETSENADGTGENAEANAEGVVEPAPWAANAKIPSKDGTTPRDADAVDQSATSAPDGESKPDASDPVAPADDKATVAASADESQGAAGDGQQQQEQKDSSSAQNEEGTEQPTTLKEGGNEQETAAEAGSAEAEALNASEANAPQEGQNAPEQDKAPPADDAKPTEPE